MNARMALLVFTGALGLAGALPAAPPEAAPPLQAGPVAGLPSAPCPAPCGSAALDPLACAPQAPRRGLEFDADFLLWWLKSAPTPALASTSAPDDLGVLGTPTGTALIGGRNYDVNPVIGARFAGRYLFNESLGAEVGGLFLENGTRTLSTAGQPVIGVPYIDPADGANAAVLLGAPGSGAGTATVRLNTFLWGLEASGLSRHQLGGGELDLVAGFRFLQLGEGLALETTTTTAVPGFFAGAVTPAGSTYAGQDTFRTRNSFYGGQLGARWRAHRGIFTLQASASVALGTTEQSVDISGSTTLRAPGAAPATAPGSVFTQATNIGQVSRHQFGVIPQAGLALGCQLTDAVRFTVGYDFLYWNSVARPGDQVDRQVNPSLPPILDIGARGGAARPAPALNGTDFWAQGVSFGIEVAF